MVVVTHGREAGGVLAGRQAAVGLAAHQQLEHRILGCVGVLVFVHQHMAHLRLPLGAHLGVVAQQFQRQADQVVKVHALVRAQALLVAAHHHGGDPLAVVSRLRQRLLGVETRTFPRADGPLPGPRRGRVGAAAGLFQDAGDVVGIQNAELGLEPQHRAIGPQHAHAQRMEGADQHLPGHTPDQGLGALAHFGGSFIGEGDGRDAVGRHPGLDQPRHFVGDDTGLARTGASQNQQRPVHVINRLLLGGIHSGRGGHARKENEGLRGGAAPQSGGRCRSILSPATAASSATASAGGHGITIG